MREIEQKICQNKYLSQWLNKMKTYILEATVLQDFFKPYILFRFFLSRHLNN